MEIGKLIWDRSTVRKTSDSIHSISQFMFNEKGQLICEADYHDFFSNADYRQRIVYIIRISTFYLDKYSEPVPKTIKNIYEIHLSEDFMKQRYKTFLKNLNDNGGIGFEPNTEMEFIVYCRSMPSNINDLLPEYKKLCDGYLVFDALDYKSNKVINGYRTFTESVEYPRTVRVFPYGCVPIDKVSFDPLPPINGIYGK